VTIEIRPVRPDEYDAAGDVTRRAYEEFVRPGDHDWESYLDELGDVTGRVDRTLVLVAVEDGRILGTATLEDDHRVEEDEDPPLRPEEVHIRMVGVDPSARGRGIGRALMDACLDEARRRGRTLVTLHTTARMKAAQRMYESMGFTREADRVFPSGFVLMTYSLPIGG
jgi:ribosomal protein S18 acetylase RimI-like enzyme